MSRDEITYEDCYNIAKQCSSSSEMEALNKKAYRKAVYRGWIKDYTWLKKENCGTGNLATKKLESTTARFHTRDQMLQHTMYL